MELDEHPLPNWSSAELAWCVCEVLCVGLDDGSGGLRGAWGGGGGGGGSGGGGCVESGGEL